MMRVEWRPVVPERECSEVAGDQGYIQILAKPVRGDAIMLKDITTITFQGTNFASPAELALFNPTDGTKIKTIKGVVLYGRNGSRKSRI